MYANIERKQNVVYAKIDGKDLLLDIYFKKTSLKEVPLIIWIHGGGWRRGDKLDDITWFVPFVEKGYVVASINYRLSDESPFPAQIYDVKSAIRWLKAHAQEYKINPHKIAIMGISAGGHLASLAGVTGEYTQLEGKVGGNLNFSSNVQAVIDIYGPINIKSYYEVLGKACIAKNCTHYFLNCNAKAPNCLSKAYTATPQSYITQNDPPFLIIHGDDDKIIPLEESEKFYKALKDKKVFAKLLIAEGIGHSPIILDRFSKEIDMFLRKHLK